MINKLILVKPSKKIEKQIIEYKNEFIKFNEKRINGSCGLIHYENFDQWLEIALSIEKDKLSNDNVHASTFFTMDGNNQIIGSIQLRHTLTDELAKYGGNIGYAIRPSHRNKGYGKRQLLLVLDVAKNMHLNKVMITCDANNLASQRVVISCGGVLEKEINHEGTINKIYWITL